MENSVKEVFESLPHVQSVWLMPNGDVFLHPKAGGEKIDREVKAAKTKEPTKK